MVAQSIQRICSPPGDRYLPPLLYWYPKASQYPLNWLCNHLWEPKLSFDVPFQSGRSFYVLIYIYYPWSRYLINLWCWFENYLLIIFFVDQKHPLLDKYNIFEILLGHLQTPYFLVLWTNFPPHPSQDNKFGNSMVFVPVGELLLDGEGGMMKRPKTDPFMPMPALFFFDSGISAENNGKLQLRKFPIPNFVWL